MATKSWSGGRDFGFFAGCEELAPSAERFSEEAWERGVGTLNGMAAPLKQMQTGAKHELQSFEL